MSLRPPSTSPSPSPGPHENGRASARQSMGPSSRGTPTLAPSSPRPGGQSSARPTSELLGTGAMAFQTPEGRFSFLPSPLVLIMFCAAEALDQWFENLQNYEATLVCEAVQARRWVRTDPGDRKIWLPHRSMSTSRKSSALLSNV